MQALYSILQSALVCHFVILLLSPNSAVGASQGPQYGCAYHGRANGLFPPATPHPRIIVTGGAGFIGSHLVKELAASHSHSHQIKVIDNLWRGDLHNLKYANGTYAIDPDHDICVGDLRDQRFADKYVRGADGVYHLADIVAGIAYVFDNQAKVFRDNVRINSNTIWAAKRNRVAWYVYAGTACSYPKHVQSEEAQQGIVRLKEDDVYPAQPESAYGWSKLMGEYEAELLSAETKDDCDDVDVDDDEDIGESRCDERGTQTSLANLYRGAPKENPLILSIPSTGRKKPMRIGILRFHNVYGPNSDSSTTKGQVVPSLIEKFLEAAYSPSVNSTATKVVRVWGRGSQYRDFVHVDDVVTALLATPHLGLDQGANQIGSGNATTIASLAHTLSEIVAGYIPGGEPVTVQFDESKREGDYGRVADIGRASRTLGWRPRITLRNGLESMVRSQMIKWEETRMGRRPSF